MYGGRFLSLMFMAVSAESEIHLTEKAALVARFLFVTTWYSQSQFCKSANVLSHLQRLS